MLFRSFPVSPPTPRPVLSPSSLRKQIQLSALCGFSLPKFTTPRCVPAEFCGSGCTDCCVNPQISFLGVQDGLMLVWLYFLDAEHRKTYMLFCHLGSLLCLLIFERQRDRETHTCIECDRKRGRERGKQRIQSRLQTQIGRAHV